MDKSKSGQPVANASKTVALQSLERVASRRLDPRRLQAAKAAARERYLQIAELLKAEAGVTRHYKFKKIGGLAWMGTGKVLAPAGITRRQLYVLAHECAHILLHSDRAAWQRPAQVKEHEAEVYAHRAFERYGLEVLAPSAQWARDYVGLWITRDRAQNIDICPLAADFAAGRRAASAPLANVDGNPRHDFSKRIDRWIAKGSAEVQRQDQLAIVTQATPAYEMPTTFQMPTMLPNAFPTCWYFKQGGSRQWKKGFCKAYGLNAYYAREHNSNYCNNGVAWRPHPNLVQKYSIEHYQRRRGYLSRLVAALLGR